tara:strand:- start:1226 stop:1723 length:498 start_codon:yes stop_codon:yes gene_type:complete
MKLEIISEKKYVLLLIFALIILGASVYTYAFISFPSHTYAQLENVHPKITSSCPSGKVMNGFDATTGEPYCRDLIDGNDGSSANTHCYYQDAIGSRKYTRGARCFTYNGPDDLNFNDALAEWGGCWFIGYPIGDMIEIWECGAHGTWTQVLPADAPCGYNCNTSI